MRIGVDVSATHASAAAVEGQTVVDSIVVPARGTVPDSAGAALSALVAPDRLDPQDITSVVIGSLHLEHALEALDGLNRVAVLRLGVPETAFPRPFSGWARYTAETIGGPVYVAPGGFEFDGRLVSQFDEDVVRRHAQEIAAAGIRAIAVTSTFSPVNPAFEFDAAEVVARELGPDTVVALSHRLPQVGFAERENAAIVNAALHEAARATIVAVVTRLRALGVCAPLYVSRNDGTIMTPESAARSPMTTFAAGAANVVQGAATLAGLAPCVVVDLDGRNLTIGLMDDDGFPRQSLQQQLIGGIPFAARMPDLFRARFPQHPRSQGASDSVDSARTVSEGMAALGSQDRPIVVVGRSAHKWTDTIGSQEAAVPHGGEAARAVGAAVAHVSGEVDRVITAWGPRRSALIHEARQEAVDRAIAAGAIPASVRIVRSEEAPLPYLPGDATRFTVTALGDLQTGLISQSS